MTPSEILSQPLKLPNGVTLRNRLVKSALSEALGTADNHPTSRLVTLYKRWADGGIGLSITGNVMVDRRALGEPGNVVIENDCDIQILREWAAAGHRDGAQIWMQINHPGKQAPKGINQETVAPSAIPFSNDIGQFFGTPRELTTHEIEDIIRRFATTAFVAKAAGFDGVQIHAAHGYLVSQFLSPLHNQRTDQWGGSPEKRRAFLMAILAEIRRLVGPGFPVGIKLNSADFQRGGFTEDESLETLKALEADGIDLVEISGGTYEAPAMTGGKTVRESTRKREAYFLEFAEKARVAIKVPLVLTGGFRTSEGMAGAISSGAIDLVGLGRSLAIEPDLPKRLLTGQKSRYDVKPISTGFKVLDKLGFMEITWYTRQIQRMGAGRDPAPEESPLKVFMLNALRLGWAVFKPQKLRA